MTHSDELEHTRRLAEHITEAFAEATAIAVKHMRDAGVATFGVDAEGRIVRREPHGAKTVIVDVRRRFFRFGVGPQFFLNG